jgi:hypothetical protein
VAFFKTLPLIVIGVITKMKECLKKINCIFLAIILSAVILVACVSAPMPPPSSPATALPTDEKCSSSLSDDETATLNSLKKVDNYPLYTMRYYGAYNRRVSSIEDVKSLVSASLPNTPLIPFSPTWACSIFTAFGGTNNMVYGRNFDWKFSPAVLLFTDPPDGHASVSMVDIAYLEFGGKKSRTITDLSIKERRTLLGAPFIPFDGMNEHGLVVGMAAVPPGHIRPDPEKETIGSLMVIRKILDHARNVDEAVAILKNYNINMGDVPIHYLIAGSSGRSVLVEFYRGKMVVIPNKRDWHHATNFLLASVSQSAVGKCKRYDRISQRLTEFHGHLTMQHAMDLLADVSARRTQWSIVYGMNTGDIEVSMGRHYKNLHRFHLNVGGD